MRRPGALGALVYGGLLVAALAAAYLDWTAEKAPAKSEVTIWDVKPTDVTAVHLKTPGATVDLTLRRDESASGSEPRPWFRVARSKNPPPARTPSPAPAPSPTATPAATGTPAATATPGATAESASPGAAEVTVKEFLGSKDVGERMKKLARLVAERDLGKLDPETAKRLGLAEPEGSLVVQMAKGDVKLDLGSLAVGDRQRYVRDPSSGKAFVVKQDLLSDIEQADTRLTNRDLHASPLDDAEKVSVRVGAIARQYAQANRGEKDKAFWAAAATPDQKDDRVTTWMGKVARLRVDRYLGEGENPLEGKPPAAPPTPPALPPPAKPGAPEATPPKPEAAKPAPGPEVVLRIDYETGGKTPAFLELTRYGSPGAEAVFVAKTEYTQGPVVVNRFLAEEAVKDLGDLFRE